jgi:hypothetical protein
MQFGIEAQALQRMFLPLSASSSDKHTKQHGVIAQETEILMHTVVN